MGSCREKFCPGNIRNKEVVAFGNRLNVRRARHQTGDQGQELAQQGRHQHCCQKWKCERRGRHGWKDKEVSLGPVEWQAATSKPRGNLRQAVREAGLAGQGELWSGEAELGATTEEVILKAERCEDVIEG